MEHWEMCDKIKVPSIFCILFLVAQLETLRTTSRCEMRKKLCPTSSIKIDLWMFTLQLGQCQHLAMGLSDDMSCTVLFPLVENWVNIIRYDERPWVFCTKSFLGKDRKFLLTRLKFYLERCDSWWHDIGIHRLHISYMLRHGHVHSLVPAPCHHSWQTLVNWILKGRWTHNRMLKKMTRINKYQWAKKDKQSMYRASSPTNGNQKVQHVKDIISTNCKRHLFALHCEIWFQGTSWGIPRVVPRSLHEAFQKWHGTLPFCRCLCCYFSLEVRVVVVVELSLTAKSMGST